MDNRRRMMLATMGGGGDIRWIFKEGETSLRDGLSWSPNNTRASVTFQNGYMALNGKNSSGYQYYIYTSFDGYKTLYFEANMENTGIFYYGTNTTSGYYRPATRTVYSIDISSVGTDGHFWLKNIYSDSLLNVYNIWLE